MKKTDRLKVVDSISIPNPCHESWDGMRGDAKVRYCEQCSHSVTDLSALTAAEAAKILGQNKETRLCVRYQQNSSGQIQYKPEAPAARHFGHPAMAFFGAILATLGLAPSAYAENNSVQLPKPSCENASPQEQPAIYKMGKPVAPIDPASEPTPVPSPIAEPTPNRNSGNSDVQELPIQPVMGIVEERK